MDTPWFGRFMGLGRFPIHWKGALFAILFLPFEIFLVNLSLAAAGSSWATPAGIAFVVTSFAGIAFVEWKTEQSYERE